LAARPRRGRRVKGSASDVAKRADMVRRCCDDGGGVSDGEIGGAEGTVGLRRHDADEASALTRAAGGSASLGVAGGSAAVVVSLSPAGGASCLGMPGCTSHLKGMEPGLLNDSSTAINTSLLCSQV